MRLAPTPFSPFPAWRCSRGYCGRSRRSPEGSWHHFYCNSHRRHQISDYEISQSCYFLWLHGQWFYGNTYVTIFLSKKYWSFFAPMTRRRETSSLSIWRERHLSVVKRRITHSSRIGWLCHSIARLHDYSFTPVQNSLWVVRVVQISGLHHHNNKHCVYWRQCDYSGHSRRQQFMETVQYGLNNII